MDLRYGRRANVAAHAGRQTYLGRVDQVMVAGLGIRSGYSDFRGLLAFSSFSFQMGCDELPCQVDASQRLGNLLNLLDHSTEVPFDSSKNFQYLTPPFRFRIGANLILPLCDYFLHMLQEYRDIKSHPRRESLPEWARLWIQPPESVAPLARL